MLLRIKWSLLLHDGGIILFAAYTPADTRNAFQWAGQPPKLPIPLGRLTPWFLGPTSPPPPNGISIGSNGFMGLTNVTNRQDRRTDRPRYSICSNMLHLAIAAMRLNAWICWLTDSEHNLNGPRMLSATILEIDEHASNYRDWRLQLAGPTVQYCCANSIMSQKI